MYQALESTRLINCLVMHAVCTEEAKARADGACGVLNEAHIHRKTKTSLIWHAAERDQHECQKGSLVRDGICAGHLL